VPDLADRLAQTTLALVDIPSESRDEAAAAAWVEAELAGAPVSLVHSADSALLYETARRPGVPLVLLAGHLDTVPAQENRPGRIEDGVVHGLGASDMKGGCAVMVELARSLAAPALDVAYLFFPREELPAEESSLPGVFAAYPAVLEADLAICLEPTNNDLHLGCVGNLNAELVFHGESAHSARPWTGVNAIERAVAGLARVFPVEPRNVDFDGLRFVEVVSATRIEGGIASNVIPERAVCLVNYRYAPDRSAAEAETRIRELGEATGADEVVIAGNSPAAPVVADAPLVRRLQAAGDLAAEPKQAWTPVAEFAAAGVDAVNFGPGATAYAHRRDEQIEVAALVRSYEVLRAFLSDTV
jgi:succinyl-diaminopimelate desuccinylase